MALSGFFGALRSFGGLQNQLRPLRSANGAKRRQTLAELLVVGLIEISKQAKWIIDELLRVRPAFLGTFQEREKAILKNHFCLQMFLFNLEICGQSG